MLSDKEIVEFFTKLSMRIKNLERIVDADREEYVRHFDVYHGSDNKTKNSYEDIELELQITKNALEWYKSENERLSKTIWNFNMNNIKKENENEPQKNTKEEIDIIIENWRKATGKEFY